MLKVTKPGIENGPRNGENCIPRRRVSFQVLQSYLFKQAMKACFVGGLICYTYEQGLWSDAFRSSCFLGKLVEKCPKDEDDEDFNEFEDPGNFAPDEPEPCAPFIPRAGFILYKLGYTWNQVVIYFFWFILDAPGEFLQAFLDLFKPAPKPVRPKECRQ